MDTLRLCLAIAAVTFIGYNIFYIVLFARSRFHILEKVFLSFGAGIGFVTLEMLALSLLNMKFNIYNIILPWAPLFVFNLYVYMKSRNKQALPEYHRQETDNMFLKIFLSVCIGLEILYVIFRTMIKPIESYDAVAIYAIKAKIFYLAGAIPQDFFSYLAPMFPHPDYPLNIPLIETFIYIFLGSLNDQLVKIIFPLFFIGILVLLYYGVRRFAHPVYSLLFVFLLATIPQFNEYATNAYLDLPFAYYYFASFLLLLFWISDNRRTGALLASAVMVALAAWTKNEGLMYCGINMLLIFAFLLYQKSKISRRGIAQAVAYICIIAVISLPWFFLKKEYGIINSDVSAEALTPFGFISQLYKLGPIVYEFQKQFFGPKKWILIWPILLFALAFNYKALLRGVNKYIVLSLVLIVGGYVFIYLISHVEINYFLSRTWARFLVHFLPVVVYLLAHLFKEDIRL